MTNFQINFVEIIFAFFSDFFSFLKNTLGEESEERDVISTEPPTPHNLIVSEHEDEEEDYEHDVDEEEDFSLDDIATDPEDDDEDDDDKPKEFPPWKFLSLIGLIMILLLLTKN